MRLTFEDLKLFLNEQQPDYGNGDVHSLMDFLYWQYAAYNSTETAQIRESLEQLYQQIQHLTFQQQNAITDLLTELCIQYEKSAFQEGFHLGVRLMMELTGAKEQDCGS